jgi:peroxiredoxin
VQKLLMAYLQPSWEAYRATANAKKYRSENEFLREHYFDHVDFADTTLLHSEVFYVLCTEYLSKYVNPQTDSSYTKAVDLILKNTLPASPVYKYILNLLINTYEDTPWENTFVHLVDDYLLKNSGPQSGWEKTLAQRSATFKKLRTGNKAPAFALNNDKGKKTDLNGISSKVVLLMFWSSTCPHCEEAMPQVKDIYTKYHPMGLEIVAVSVDTDKKAWLEALEANRMEWVNVSDLKGMVSPVVESYNAFSTPTFYLLDKDKTIIAHPDSPKELKESIEKALKE